MSTGYVKLHVRKFMFSGVTCVITCAATRETSLKWCAPFPHFRTRQLFLLLGSCWATTPTPLIATLPHSRTHTPHPHTHLDHGLELRGRRVGDLLGGERDLVRVYVVVTCGKQKETLHERYRNWNLNCSTPGSGVEGQVSRAGGSRVGYVGLEIQGLGGPG